jgi:hypothetical protein
VPGDSPWANPEPARWIGCRAPLQWDRLAGTASHRCRVHTAAEIERSSSCAERPSSWYSQRRSWRDASGWARRREPPRRSAVRPSVVTRTA